MNVVIRLRVLTVVAFLCLWAEGEAGKAAIPLRPLREPEPTETIASGLQDLFRAAEPISAPPEVKCVTYICYASDVAYDLVGRFYDFKRSRTGKPVYMDEQRFTTLVDRFVRADWNPLIRFGGYYRSPMSLYTGSVMIPPMPAAAAPSEFDEPDCAPNYWLVLYRGRIVYPEPITFRFRGWGDNLLVVRVGRRIVLAACSRHSGALRKHRFSQVWKSSSRESRKYRMGTGKAEVGDWITLAPCEELDMEVLIGHVSGRNFGAMLAVEEQGVEYPEGKEGNPILPMFRMFEPRTNPVAAIQQRLPPGQIDVSGGPVFNN